MSQKPQILTVDDEPFYLEELDNLLHDDYAIICAEDGQQTLQLAHQSPQPTHRTRACAPISKSASCADNCGNFPKTE